MKGNAHLAYPIKTGDFPGLMSILLLYHYLSMIRISFLFLVIALIATIQLLSNDIAVSVIPGWHTSILPSFAILSFLAYCWLLLLPVGYLILERKKQQPGKGMIYVHLAFTLVYFFNAVFYSYPLLILGLFASGQALFILSFVSNLRRAFRITNGCGSC